MNVGFSTQISILGAFCNIICNTEWWMTFHYISILFYHVCLSKAVEILGNWNAAMCGEPLNMSIVYSTAMILMMYSPSEKSKGSCDFFSPRTLKQRIRYWLYCIQHELWCCLEWVWDFNPKEEKEGWVDGMVSNRVQRLAVSPCFDPEPSVLCRTADCEGQYNPQCLALQRLIKYLMC